MTLSELQEAWAKDAIIDQTNLGHAAARVPVLHAKYITHLSNYRLQLRKAEVSYHKLRNLKSRYFRGELSKEELAALGWPQYLRTRPLKTELEDLIQADDEIVDASDKVEYIRTVLVFLEGVVRSINSRTWDIKSAIEWEKFRNGEF